MFLRYAVGYGLQIHSPYHRIQSLHVSNKLILVFQEQNLGSCKDDIKSRYSVAFVENGCFFSMLLVASNVTRPSPALERTHTQNENSSNISKKIRSQSCKKMESFTCFYGGKSGWIVKIRHHRKKLRQKGFSVVSYYSGAVGRCSVL